MSSLITSTVALSSIFTPPASCQTHWTYEDSNFNNNTNGLLIQNAQSENLDAACFPAGFTQYGRNIRNTQIFSPGACPAGYSTAANYNGQTTTAVCCPTSFSYYTTISSVTGQDSVSVELAGCLSMFHLGTETTVPGVIFGGSLSTTVATGPVTMWAQPINVAYQQADLALYTTSTAPTATPASTQQVASLASSTGTPSSQSAGDTSSGLSAGAIAGIAIGAAAVLAILMGVLLFLKRRRRRSNVAGREDYQDEKVDHTVAGQSVQEHCAELPGGKSRWDHEVHEVSAQEPAAQEMYTSKNDSSHRVELG